MSRTPPEKVVTIEEGGVVVVEKAPRLNTALATLALTILLNMAGLVWGASRLSSSVDALKETTVKLEATVSKISDAQADHNARLRVLEDRDRRQQ